MDSLRKLLLPLAVASIAGVTALAHQFLSGTFDQEPPFLAVELTTTVLRGTHVLQVKVEDQVPGGHTIEAKIDGKPAPLLRDETGAYALPLPTVTLKDGAHDLEVSATDSSWFGNRTIFTSIFHTDNTPPSVEITRASLTGAQGQTIGILIRGNESIGDPTLIFEEQELPMFPVAPGIWRGLLGVPIRQKPGATPLIVLTEDRAGNLLEAEFSLIITEYPFEKGGRVTLSAVQVEARQDSAGKIAARNARDEAYTAEIPTAYWNGPLDWPIAARTSSSFGKFREYSDGVRNHHDGIDLAARRGSPITAAADGIVLVSERQPIHGNAVIIGHGQGLTTSYNHMDTLAVTVGAQVKRGELVGILGNTGQSTGPHLHWGMVLNGIPVNAQQWVTYSFTVDELSNEGWVAAAGPPQ